MPCPTYLSCGRALALVPLLALLLFNKVEVTNILILRPAVNMCSSLTLIKASDASVTVLPVPGTVAATSACVTSRLAWYSKLGQ